MSNISHYDVIVLRYIVLNEVSSAQSSNWFHRGEVKYFEEVRNSPEATMNTSEIGIGLRHTPSRVTAPHPPLKTRDARPLPGFPAIWKKRRAPAGLARRGTRVFLCARR